MDDTEQMAEGSEQLTIVLDGALAAYIRARVAAGDYPSSNELIQDVLRVWQDNGDLSGFSVDAIRARIAETDADPRPSITDAEVEAYFANRGPGYAIIASRT